MHGSDPSTPKIVGKVKNTGKTDANDAVAIAALLDKDGKVLDVNSGNTTLTSLTPGQQSAFEIRFDNGAGATQFQIVVTALTKK